jgi:hypothetical protein
MFSDFKPVTIKDATTALNALNNITRPDGDNEGDAINSASVYRKLTAEDQDLVDHAEKIVGDYVRQNPERSITELHKRGYTARFNQDQYESDRNVGSVEVNDWVLDISDESNESEEY